MFNIVLEQLNQFIGKLIRTYNINKTYVEKDDRILVILTAAAFTVLLTENGLNYYSTGQLLFGSDIILLIKHTVD